MLKTWCPTRAVEAHTAEQFYNVFTSDNTELSHRRQMKENILYEMLCALNNLCSL